MLFPLSPAGLFSSGKKKKVTEFWTSPKLGKWALLLPLSQKLGKTFILEVNILGLQATRKITPEINTL